MPVLFRPLAAKPDSIEPMTVENWFAGKWRYEIPIGWGGDMAPTYLRLAEMYLIKAEALNELNGGPTAEAYAALNAVRQRAHIPDIDEAYLNAPNPHANPDLLYGMQTDQYIADYTDPTYPGRHEYYTSGFISYPTLQDKFRAAVLMERAWELCFERQRWMDLKRTKMLEQVLLPDRFKQLTGLKFDQSHAADDPHVKIPANWDPATTLEITTNLAGVGRYNKMITNFTPSKNYRWPIPQSERDANDNLTQNPEY
jgi:hypothetical protein